MSTDAATFATADPAMESPATPPSFLDPAALPDDPAVLKHMIAELLRESRHLRRDLSATQQRLDALLRRLYGPKPDPTHPDQPLLFVNGEAPPAPPPTSAEPPARRGQCQPHGRRRPKKELRREIRRHELPAAERGCPDCGQERTEIGVETRSVYDYKPAEVFVVEDQRVKYACKHCEGQVAIAAKPPSPIDRGLPGPGLLAQIVVDKYQDHLPLYRSEHRFARLGVHLPRSTMADWMAAAAMRLTPLYLLLKEQVLGSKVLHTDDTTVPVRDESRSSHRIGRLWVYIGDCLHPGVVFDYTPTHARDGPVEFLRGFQGYLQADAYGGYDGIYAGSNGAIREVACWAHTRNKFKDAQSTDPERVLAAKAWVRQLYDVEDEATEAKLSAVERARLRQAKALPRLNDFRQWLLAQKEDALPKSPFGQALRYALNQWEALCRYTTDGDLAIDNNLAERTLKLVGIGRRNWLFVGSDQGGHTAAVLYSFTATCKRLGINCFAYLRDGFDRLPTTRSDRLAELLPNRWQAARQAAAVPPVQS